MSSDDTELLVWSAVLVLGLCALIGYGAWLLTRDDLESTWPETAEFSQLYTGQDRFSEHATNLDDTYVLVDHETGVCYVCTPDGVAVMVDAEGEPVREKESA